MITMDKLDVISQVVQSLGGCCCRDCYCFDTRGFEPVPDDDKPLQSGYCSIFQRETQACCFCSRGALPTNEEIRM